MTRIVACWIALTMAACGLLLMIGIDNILVSGLIGTGFGISGVVLGIMWDRRNDRSAS